MHATNMEMGKEKYKIQLSKSVLTTSKSCESICGYGAVSSFMEYTGAVDDDDDDGDDVVDKCDE